MIIINLLRANDIKRTCEPSGNYNLNIDPFLFHRRGKTRLTHCKYLNIIIKTVCACIHFKKNIKNEIAALYTYFINSSNTCIIFIYLFYKHILYICSHTNIYTYTSKMLRTHEQSIRRHVGFHYQND